MRTAPPVDAPVSAGRAERCLSAALYALAAASAAIGIGSALELEPGWLPTLLAAAVAACCGAASWRAPRGRLRWDGRGWLLVGVAGEAQPLARLQLQLDLGRWVLLRWQGTGRARPVWASLRAADAADWHGLRVALAAHGRPAIGDDSA